MTLDLVTLNYTLSIAHSLCQLAVGVPRLFQFCFENHWISPSIKNRRVYCLWIEFRKKLLNPLITICFRQYQPESVYVLPKTSKARIVEIYSPEEYKKMPKKMQWEELRRYWRRVYGYLLSPNPEPCVDIEFYRGM